MGRTVTPDDDMVTVTMSELELLVATAIEAADPHLPGGLEEFDTNPVDWLPEARAAVLTMVQLLRDRSGDGLARHAAGWMEAADWLEDQLLNDDNVLSGLGAEDNEADEDPDGDD